MSGPAVRTHLEPLDLLLAVNHSLADGRAAPGEAVTWFCRAVDLWLVGEVQTLDEAFGLRPDPGHRRAPTIRRMMARDEALIAAGEQFGDLPAAERARRISTALSRYAASSWRRDSAASACPYPQASLQAALWQALRAGDGRPLSAERIRRLLVASSPYS